MEHDSRIGAVLQGRYKVVERVAEGGMGVVYRGERIGLERQVAIKFLHESVTANKETRRRFETEAKAASRLGHPNCVAVMDFGVDEDIPYLVMDFVPGRTLRDILKDGPLAVARAIDIGAQVLAGLAHAHGHGIVHRDLKPDNILVYSDAGTEHARIIDFGLAKLKGAATITDGVAVGTPSYMSPEQTLGQRADARSDVYGAGVLLFELLTGRKPFRGNTPFEVMRLHREEPIPTFAHISFDRDVPQALEEVVRKALAKSPDDRYPSAIEFASALDAAYESRAKEIIDDIERPHHHRVALFGLVVLAAGIAAWFVFGRTPDDPGAPADPEPTVVAADAAVAVDAASGSTAAPIAEVADALRLAQTQPVQAIEALERLRAKHPTSGQVSHALGRINAERERWSASVDAYAEAIQKDPAYRSDKHVIRDLVQALRSEKAHEQAATLIVGALGAAAIAELDAAASKGDDPLLRGRAARVRARLR